MGNYEENNERLIDFLYKDTETLDSLYSQIFRGKLESIIKTQDESTKEMSSLGSDVKLVKGSLSTENSNKESISQQINPHDFKLIDLLSNLNLDTFNENLDGVNENQLICISGSMILRDTSIINDVLNLSDLFALLPGFEEFNQPFAPAKKGKPVTMINALKRMATLIPQGIEIEIHMNNNCIVYGSLVKDYISPSLTLLLNAYSNSLPKDCSIIGIVNKSTSSNVVSKSPIKGPLDDISRGLLQLINSDESYQYTIKPIIIYRYLHI